MEVRIRRCTLLEDVYKTGSVECFDEKIQNYMHLITNLINDVDKLPPKEYLDLLSMFYAISFDENDYLKALSKLNDKDYVSYQRIKTRMIDSNKKHDGYGNVRIWSENNEQITLLAAVSNNLKIDKDKEYSKIEINDMLADNNIVIVDIIRDKIAKLPIVSEKYEELPVVNIGISDGEFFKNNLAIFGKILKEAMTPEKIREDLIKFMDVLNYQLRTITIFNKGNYEELNLDIKDKWLPSQLKRDYEELEERVNSK